MISWTLQFFYLLSLVTWVGGIIFFSFFTTPMVFKHLPKEIGSHFISQIFPNYYLLAYICGAILIITSLGESILARQVPWVRIILIALMLGSSIYAGTVILPEAHRHKIELKTMEESVQATSPIKKRFDTLHLRSVILNMAILIMGFCLIGILAWRLRV
ncbi:MAG: DUF4149 domain-containing protein [Deltaproteobacteria bacterium]|nr:DUF4149 domain-containing protein [Deltaproteobacteria bacterium]